MVIEREEFIIYIVNIVAFQHIRIFTILKGRKKNWKIFRDLNEE